jgi:L-alanine-DL-glutamate epimerase-like enolase superfamily enzyme
VTLVIDTGIAEVDVSAYDIPTAVPESDGTAEWKSVGLVVVEVSAADKKGLGYTYADPGAARLVRDVLAKAVRGIHPFDIVAMHGAMVRAVRNQGRGGVAAMAISAVDVACWDLKAKLLDLPLARLIGLVRPKVPAYASGGFTSMSERELVNQLSGWVEKGFRSVKMKVGREPERDLDRVRAARKAIGPGVELFVDANGAYQRKQALAFAERFAELGVTWFEEPVVRTDVPGLRLVRDRAPSGMEIAGGEYGYEPADFRTFLDAQALDVIQADATRCGGITGFLRNAAQIDTHELPISSHCAPALHTALGCAALAVRHVEWFIDHVLIEQTLFDGAARPEKGELRPDPLQPGLGLTFKRGEAAQYRVRL